MLREAPKKSFLIYKYFIFLIIYLYIDDLLKSLNELDRRNNFHENFIHFAVVMQLYQNKNKIFALKDSKHDIKDMPYIKMKSELDNLIYEVKTGH